VAQRLAGHRSACHPCALPVNLTIPKTVVRGLGSFFLFVNDETGSIISTGAAYHDLVVRDTAAFASDAGRTRFYGLNIEHCQSEACAEVAQRELRRHLRARV